MDSTKTLVIFAIFAALGVATLVIPILQISYAAGVPSCSSVNEHHQPPICRPHRLRL